MFRLDVSGHIPIDEAVKGLCSCWTPAAGTQRIGVSDALGRVASDDITAILDIPVHRSADSDGVAVRSSDFAHGVPNTSAWVAGENYETVDMGDDFPDSFDAVIPIEMARLSGGGISFQSDAHAAEGQGVVRRGSSVASGDLLVRKGELLSPLSLANLVMGGVESLEVTVRPRIAFIPTGSELVPMGEKPARGQVVDCNSILAKNLLRDLGADITALPIVRDVPEVLEQVLEQALDSFDIVLINGGSSKGQEDFCPKLLEKDSSFFHHYVKVRPGRPIALAIKRGKPVINIPGPTTAALFAFMWCVRALIQKWYGIPEYPQPVLRVKTENPLALDNFPLAYGLLFHVYTDNGVLTAKHLDSAKSLAERFRDANAYAILPLGSAGFKAGDMIDVYPIGHGI